jgi:N-acyl-D-aspartate/D-glutamate deacylase
MCGTRDGLATGERSAARRSGSAGAARGDYVRERGWLSLEKAIKKMTSMPTAKFGFRDRGLLRPGLAADVVVFDPATVQDNASFERPAVYPTGIAHVFVNGHPAVDSGRLTGGRAGQVLAP